MIDVLKEILLVLEADRNLQTSHIQLDANRSRKFITNILFLSVLSFCPQSALCA